MGDDFDPCECVWSHEMAMRRLISMLRNSQSDCTDTQCFTFGNPSTTTDNSGNLEGMLFMTMAIVFALFMYYMRPRNQRNAYLEPSKPAQNDFNGSPPSPPPAST